MLGGGGIAGLAWEAGVLAGLAEAGVDLGAAERVIGTSAGAILGAQLAGGVAPAEIRGRQATPAPLVPGEAPSLDVAKLGEILTLWAGADALDPPTCAKLGALALDATAVAQERLVEGVAALLDGIEWPPGLAVTAVDAHSGAFELFGAEHGLPLAPAVAASCAVPGFFEPVAIADRRYIDGGARSGTSADVLVEPEPPRHALVIAPLSVPGAPGLGAQMARCMESELASLRAAGADVVAIAPDAADLDAIGPNAMDASRRAPALEAGVARGRREAGAAHLAPWRR